jgi:hypothetical protein
MVLILFAAVLILTATSTQPSCEANLNIELAATPDKKDDEAPVSSCTISADMTSTISSTEKYLLAHCGPAFDTGFGDRMQWYYGMIALSAVLNRTFVAPPILFAEQNYSLLLPYLQNVDPETVLDDPARTRSFQELYFHERAGDTKYSYAAFSNVFEVPKSKVGVVDFFYWVKHSSGIANQVLVPASENDTGAFPYPKWHTQCQDGNQSLGARCLFRYGEPIQYEGVECLDISRLHFDKSLKGSNLDRKNSLALIAEVLSAQNRRESATLVLEGFCYLDHPLFPEE